MSKHPFATCAFTLMHANELMLSLPIMCFNSCRRSCVCMEGWIRGRLLVVHRSQRQHWGLASQHGIIWTFKKFIKHVRCLLHQLFSAVIDLFVIDFGRRGRFNSLGVQEVSQCLQKSPGHRRGECHWCSQVSWGFNFKSYRQRIKYMSRCLVGTFFMCNFMALFLLLLCFRLMYLSLD